MAHALLGMQTVRDRNAVIFAVIAIVPLLLFLSVLGQPQLIPGYEAALPLGVGVGMAILGFLLLHQTGTQISALADYVRDVRRMVTKLSILRREEGHSAEVEVGFTRPQRI